MGPMRSLDKMLLGAGVLCMLVTVAVTLLVNPLWTPMSVVSLIGLLWSEAVFFGGLCFIRMKSASDPSAFLKVGGGFVVVVFAVSMFVTSAVFFPLLSVVMPWFFVIQLLLLAAFVCVLSVIFFLEKRFRASDEAASKGMAHAARRSIQVSDLARRCSNKESRRKLERCADDLKYVDTTVQVQADSRIDGIIESMRESLDAHDREEVDAEQFDHGLMKAVVELERAIAARKDEAAIAKRGGF